MARPINRVENYTTPALVMGFVNLLWFFGVLLAIWGLPAVLVAGWVLNYAITLFERHLRAQGKYP
ncbi:hypothetical protein [Shimia sp. SDUM112013]|uniref:hypothetical protein n=1 Tax=Shimia sp. SDUM112013 TaxID=3136160 RepID=UPI0032EC3D00